MQIKNSKIRPYRVSSSYCQPSSIRRHSPTYLCYRSPLHPLLDQGEKNMSHHLSIWAEAYDAERSLGVSKPGNFFQVGRVEDLARPRAKANGKGISLRVEGTTLRPQASWVERTQFHQNLDWHREYRETTWNQNDGCLPSLGPRYQVQLLCLGGWISDDNASVGRGSEAQPQLLLYQSLARKARSFK